ncbi:HNH endonuclease [Exiguobacterium sp. SL14]|nr:HNH endonuclease [Exiguobacterium sp. SL14]MCY1689592.1 HNH endonuclease [Exiguobacterium sp. SL14]
MSLKNKAVIIRDLTKEWLKNFALKNGLNIIQTKYLILNDIKIGVRARSQDVSNSRFGIRETNVRDYNYLIFVSSDESTILENVKQMKFVILNQKQLIELKLKLGNSDKSFKMNNYYPFIDFLEFESEIKKILQPKKEYFIDGVDQLYSVIEEKMVKYGIGEYDEGTKKLIVHYLAERNATVVRKAKELFELEDGHLYCDICKFDYFEAYGILGNGYIEAHHKEPLSLNGQTTTEIEDFALLCASCHRMIHKLMKVQLNNSYEELKRSLKAHMGIK